MEARPERRYALVERPFLARRVRWRAGAATGEDSPSVPEGEAPAPGDEAPAPVPRLA